MEGLYRLNPFCWTKRTIRVFVACFFLIMLPIYLYIGFQPVASTEALSYPTLKIDDISLSTPVEPLQLTDHQLIAPANIAGSYSSQPNKTLIIGHSSTVFRQLDQIRIGESLVYNEKTYRITKREILEKSAIDMTAILATSDVDTIIIMTCAGEPLPNQDATHRLIVTATIE